MIFVQNSNSPLTLEEQKLKLLIIITECEVEVDRIERRIIKEGNLSHYNESFLASIRERY